MEPMGSQGFAITVGGTVPVTLTKTWLHFFCCSGQNCDAAADDAAAGDDDEDDDDDDDDHDDCENVGAGDDSRMRR